MHKITFICLLLTVSFFKPELSWSENTLEEHSESVEIYKKISLAQGTTTESQEPEEDSQNELQYLLTSTHMRYELTPQSSLIGKNGKQLAPDNLKVPCTAIIRYEILSNGYRNLKSLRVKSYSHGATKEWTFESMD